MQRKTDANASAVVSFFHCRLSPLVYHEIQQIIVVIIVKSSTVIATIANNSRSWNVYVFLYVSSSCFCTYSECIESKCHGDVAPYICLSHDGANLGGW
jgi:hypothetical protein